MRYISCLLVLFVSGCIELEDAAENPGSENIVNLSWTTPSRLEDESPLDSRIAKYYVHWGESENELVNIEEVDGNTLSLNGLPSGSYYFSVSVETESGDRSLPSNIVHKVFN